MRIRKIVAAAALLAAIPAFAVFNERSLGQTLAVLRQELHDTYEKIHTQEQRSSSASNAQHARMVSIVNRSNELSLMLYSQKEDYTFDQTYALNEVSKQYNEFARNKMPFDRIVGLMDSEIERYERLTAALRRLPPALASIQNDTTLREHLDSLDMSLVIGENPLESDEFSLDSIGRVNRDSCLMYSLAILDNYKSLKSTIVSDSTYYAETGIMLKSAYDYAQERYNRIQRTIFKDGQTDYLTILRQPQRYFRRAEADTKEKYTSLNGIHSDWRGPMVTWLAIIVLFYLILAVGLMRITVRLLHNRIRFFESDAYLRHKTEYQMLAAVIIFAVTLWLASSIATHSFISMASGLLVEFAWMLAAILTSIIIRTDNEEDGKRSLLIYAPIIILYFTIIVFRIIFIPNSLVNIVFPPVLLGFTIWQGIACSRQKGHGNAAVIHGWLSFAVLAVTTVIVWCGYVLLGIQLLIWWTFQLALIISIQAIYSLFSYYYNSHVSKRIKKYKEEHPHMPRHRREDFISISWLYDFLKMAVVPAASVWSIPAAIFLASDVFDITSIVSRYFNFPFLDIEGYIHLSARKIMVVITMYFFFRYLEYAAKAIYRLYKIRSMQKKLHTYDIHETDLNLNLANNVISIVIWGIFVISIFVMWKIPTAAIGVAGAGLATGLGFAMKDVLNNFFYGIQLMGGRLRIGDYVECDGVRGKVDSINYQSTQILSDEGAIMAFPNATLFNKNFKNLTRNHSYELTKIEFGVAYGVDIEKVRELVIEALKPLSTVDKFGREIVDQEYGVKVRFSGFGDSCIQLTALQFVTVESYYDYSAKAKELIYNCLNEHNIAIPFPQQDIYIKSLPGEVKD